MINIGFDENTAVEKYIIAIRDKNDTVKARYALNSKDTEKNTLMSEHYIQLEEFSLDSLVKFARTDYIIWEGEKYMIKEDYIPDQANKLEYKYTLRFDHWTTFLQDDTFYYTNQGLEEAEWSLTSNAGIFFQLLADNANRYFGVNTFNVATIEFDEIKFLTFSKVSIWDAATQIAEAYQGEWYLTGTTFHLVKKFSYGSEIDFETEVSVEKMDRSEGENSEKYTRILAFGSTRNIPANYRKTTSGESVDAIYQKRLRIPATKGNFINIHPNLSPEEVKSAVVIFDDIYPKRIGTMSSISTVEYTDTNTDTGEVTKWNAYRYKDTGLQFKSEYLLPGIELRLVFQSGNLNGMDFEVKFNPLGKPETDSQSQLFEIIRNENYGKALPNDTLKPQNGDTYILYGFNIQLVSDQYIPAGEEELFQTATQWLTNNNKDKSVFECPTLIEYFTDHEMDLEIGQKIRLIHDQFEGGLRLSRIQGYEKHLLDKYQATYTVGDNATVSWAKNVEESIKELQIAGITYQTTGNNGVYLIKQFDNTPANDFNAYSAKASDARYLNRISGGTVLGDTTFYKDVKIQGKTISNQFGNETFMPGMLGNGFRFWIENGLSYGQLDYLTITREMLISVLTVAEIKSVDGGIIVSAANMVCSKVEELTNGYKCYFDNDNGNIPNKFALGDQAICRRFNGANVKYYWRLVTAIGADYITLSKTDKDGSGIPSAKDNIVQFGNRTNTQRQFAVYTVGYGDAGTYYYYGVNSYDLTGKAKTYFSKEGSRIEGDSIIFTSSGKSASSAINEAQTAANTANAGLLTKVSYSEYNTQMQITNNQIASKVSQTDFNTLGGRVSAAESSITINANNITSVVETVNNIQIGGKNLVDDSKGTYSVGGGGSSSNEIISNLGIYANLIEGETYTFQCKTDGVWGAANGTDTVESFLLKDWSTAAGNYVRMATNPYTFKAPKTGKFYIRIDSNKGDVKHDFWEFQIEKGNKVTDWSESSNDINKAIKNAEDKATEAQNTANLKNKTYYQDAEPTPPSGGFIPGDVWYMNSLVDIDGNINTDTGKNIYQLQRRWNGITWARINWSASRSQITQTTEFISQLIEKTGIDSLGNGETLYSKINQTESEIRLEVSKIQIGGVNLLNNSSFENGIGNSSIVNGSNITRISGGYHGNYCMRTVSINRNDSGYTWHSLPTAIGKEYIVSCYVRADLSINQCEFGIYTGSWQWVKNKSVNVSPEWRRIDISFTATGTLMRMCILKANATFYVDCIQLEEGSKATSWNLSPEDIQAQIDSKTTINEVASSLTITNNKISLASKTIELNGTTVAEAIKAGELNVGDGNFYVGQDGKIKAKGATLEGSLEIGWDGDASKPANRITVVDRSSANQKTKVLITPQNITPLSSIGGNTTYPSVVSAGAAVSRKINYFENDLSWTGANINLAVGKIYDVVIPAISFTAQGTSTGLGRYAMYLDNITTGESFTAIANTAEVYVQEDKSVTLSGLQPGSYRLRITLAASGTSGEYASFSIPANANYTVRPITDAVEIGANGMCGIFTTNRYFHVTTDGFYIRMGDYGFRISESYGIQKSTNLYLATPTWTNI